jgi:hypothetical protein
VALGGELVGGEERNQALLASRPLMLRAFYEVDEGFVTRDIYALMTLHHEDGSTFEVGSFQRVGEQDYCEPDDPRYECGYGSLIRSFNFMIPEDQSLAGVHYSIEMFETSPGHEDDVSDKSPVFPYDGGTMILGIEERYMKMRVMMVPFKHDLGPDCHEAPDLTAPWSGTEITVAEFMAERLMAFNPTDEVTVEAHDVINYTGDATDSGGILSYLQQLRVQESAPPEYFYYGVIRPCDGGPDFSGVSMVGGPTKNAASRRVSWGVWYASGVPAGTFVHETGHAQGRAHIACSGTEAGPDPSYPDHPEGDTESWGMDVIRSIEVHPPSDHDYMTYCGSQWVSEWGWTLVFPWIRELSSWEEQGADVDPPIALLYGHITADDESSWFVGDGWFDEAEVSDWQSVEFNRGGQTMAATAAVYERFPKSDAYNLIVPVPDDFDEVTTFSWLDAAGGTHVVDRATITDVRNATAPK